MNKKFNYEQWYSEQNSKKSDLLYERLTKEFVGKNLLNEQVEKIKAAAVNYDLTSNKELMASTKKVAGEKLSFYLGIDSGTTEGQYIVDLAARFVLNHVIDIQIKGQEKPVEQKPSMLKDLGELLKAIVVNAAKENKELFSQFSSASRAKAATDVIKKQAGKDFEEFGSELSRTGKQAWSDVKSGVSNLFETAPVAGAAAGTGTAVVAATTEAIATTATAVAPQAATAAVTGVTTATKIAASAETAAIVAKAVSSITYSFIKTGVIITAGLGLITAILQSVGLVNLGLGKLTRKAEEAAGEKAPGILSVFSDDTDDSNNQKNKKTSKGKKVLDPSKVGTSNY